MCFYLSKYGFLKFVLKIKNKNGASVNLENSSNLKVEDPVITLSSKSGTGLIIQKVR